MLAESLQEEMSLLDLVPDCPVPVVQVRTLEFSGLNKLPKARKKWLRLVLRKASFLPHQMMLWGPRSKTPASRPHHLSVPAGRVLQ